LGEDSPSEPGIKRQIFALAHALDDEGAAGRIVEPHGQDFLVFGRIVPALHRRSVGEFEDDDPFRLRSAFDQCGRAAAGQEAAAILLQRGVDRRAIAREPGLVCDLVFGDEIDVIFASLLTFSGAAA
jgi:hypothetical protein